jgi:hypothetical protein
MRNTPMKIPGQASHAANTEDWSIVHADEHRPRAGKKIAETFPDPDPEIAVERLEGNRSCVARRLGRSRIGVGAR